MTSEQLQTAKEVLELYGYIVVNGRDYLSIAHPDYEVIKLKYFSNRDKIFISPVPGFYSAGQIKKEFAVVYEVMIDLNLNGVPVAM